jgi:hypothetical protein
VKQNERNWKGGKREIKIPLYKKKMADEAK